ncbi:MAG TPA: hypothetical protein VLS27_12450 [Gammaproteobacteria bacterium]|nr:hypothetical protein [Gammaproteobacteria bacterium]
MTASRAIVKKKIRQYWPHDADDVMEALDRYGDPSPAEAGRARVQLAVLKLANGSLERLREYVDLARRDYRDVLALAEYPREMKATHLVRPELSPRQRRELARIRKQDREQYLKWLKNA